MLRSELNSPGAALRSIRDKILALFSRRPPDRVAPALITGTGTAFNYDFAQELLRLIGNTYVEYFATRYGPHSDQWKPASARWNYARYLPAKTPAGYESLCTINLIGGEARWPIGRILRRGEDEIYIIFRGTVSEEEWIKDILVMQTENTLPFNAALEGGSVHLGFLRMFRRLDPPPEEWATYMNIAGKATAGPIKKIKLWIAGHSLGGALGTLTALQYHAYKPTLLTYGSPRVGDPTFAATFDALVPNSIRIANQWDPVVNLPDEEVDLLFRRYRYTHVGQPTPVFALSQIDGPALVKIIDENENWRDWKDYVLETLLDPQSGHRIDPLFAHQLRTYEYALVRDRGLKS